MFENHWVICAFVKNGKIQLEERTELDKPMFGHVIVPGGTVESRETIEEACMRESEEEYGVRPVEYRKIGIVFNTSSKGTLDFRHVFLITDWSGELTNKENRNKHLSATLSEAKTVCKHPVTQEILDLIDKELAGNY